MPWKLKRVVLGVGRGMSRERGGSKNINLVESGGRGAQGKNCELEGKGSLKGTRQERGCSRGEGKNPRGGSGFVEEGKGPVRQGTQ